MIKEVYPNIFMKEFPLTGNPLRGINIYIIKTDSGNMIIDTGFNNEECRKSMDEFIEETGIDIANTYLFLTHLHSDHIGLSSYLYKKGIKDVYISSTDGRLLRTGLTKDGEQWQSTMENMRTQGMEAEGLTLEDHPGYRNRPREIFPYTPIEAGYNINLGEFNFETIDEAGHTPGMLGLYDREKEILFCGDHILGKITPNITFWSNKYGDSLGTYLKNIEKLKSLPIKYLFSSHRFLIDNVNERIEELQEHHKNRLDDTLEILEKYGKSNTVDVTKKLNWDIRAKDWDDFPQTQKWFAAGEAASHLVHLVEVGKVNVEMIDGIAIYSLA